MRIKKVSQSSGYVGTVSNSYSPSTTDTYSCDYLNTKGITESGSNTNGNYIKYDDGTMICWGRRTFTGVAVNVAWGSMYESSTAADMGDYPVAFISRPFISVQCISGTGLATVFLEQIQVTENTPGKIGKFLACRPTSTNSMNFGIDFIAIGRWK